MPHDVQKMIFVGVEPWHGLGTKLPRNASYEDIVEAAGFFTVVERPVFVPGKLDPVPDTKALIREETHEVLAVVGSKYQLVQAADVARTLVEAASGVGAIFHTAGTLGRSGSRFWLLGELPQPIRVRGDASPIKKYILGTSAHDGESPVIIMNVGVRVVCANTLGSALGEETQARWQIRHTRSAPDRLREAARGFGELVRGYEKFEALANALAGARFTDQQLGYTLDRVMPIPSDERDHTRLEKGRAKVVELFQEGVGMGGIRGTAWGAWQALTEYADHHRPIRGGMHAPASLRLESIWLGAAAELKRHALAAIANEANIRLAAA